MKLRLTAQMWNQLPSAIDGFEMVVKLKFDAPLRVIVAPIPLTPFPLRKGGKIGGYRPCDLVWGFAPNPV